MSSLRWFGCLVLVGLWACESSESPPSRDAAVDAGGQPPDASDTGDAGDLPDGSAEDAGSALETIALAPLAGPHQRRANGQESLAFYGTDLGYTVNHGGELRILFGDTYVSDTRTFLTNDDAFGTLAFNECPAGDAVESFVAASASADDAWWQHAGPELSFATAEPDELDFVRTVLDGEQLTMSGLQVPISVWSDGADRLFGMFVRSEFATCSAEDRAGCPDDFECDTGLGTCTGLAFALPCLPGTVRGEEGACPRDGVCVEMGGHCRDPHSAIDDGGTVGRILSVAHRLQVGVETEPGSSEFTVTPWITNKLMNSFTRAVRDFDETRAHGEGNDYRNPDGEGLERAKVLVWGRPNYVGSKARDRQAQLYLALADLPELDAEGAPSWAPRYFAGLDDDGAPRFVAEQSEAVPLDQSGGEGDPSEPNDLINQMSVSWIEPLGRWVMLYGGDLDPDATDFYNRGAQRNEDGAIFVRFAEQPWGPWSKPEVILAAGDPAEPNRAGSQYAAGGVLYHPDCEGDACVPGDPFTLTGEDIVPYGWLYGANVVDCWTTERGADGVDLYWNVSTWNPYQVVLMKTRVR